MKKYVVITVAMVAMLAMVSCKKDDAKNNNVETTVETTVSEQTTVADTTEQTTTVESTMEPSTEAVDNTKNLSRYSGTFTDYMGRQNKMVVSNSGESYTLKFKLENNANAKGLAVGEYTAKFKFGDVKKNSEGAYHLTTKIKGNGKEYDFVIDFYGEEDIISGASVLIGNVGFEMTQGSPA